MAYGFASNLREALPKASFIGFTARYREDGREHAGGFRQLHQHLHIQPSPAMLDQIFTLNSSPFFTDWQNAAISSGIFSKSARFTTSTGECM